MLEKMFICNFYSEIKQVAYKLITHIKNDDEVG